MIFRQARNSLIYDFSLSFFFLGCISSLTIMLTYYESIIDLATLRGVSVRYSFFNHSKKGILEIPFLEEAVLVVYHYPR